MAWWLTGAASVQVQLFCKESNNMPDLIYKPQPRISPLTKPFWDAVNHNKLMIQKCESADCLKHIFYPRASCPYCHGSKLRWIQAQGSGVVISNTTIHRPHHEGFSQDCPYAFAAIGLKEGPCIYAKLIHAPIDVSLVGLGVTIEFELHGPAQKIPVFILTGR
jgi:uncharacterized protein